MGLQPGTLEARDGSANLNATQQGPYYNYYCYMHGTFLILEISSFKLYEFRQYPQSKYPVLH